MEILCFFAGAAFFYTNSALCLLLMFALLFKPSSAYPICFLAGLSYCLVHEWLIADQGMGNKALKVMPKVFIEGEIVSIPTATEAKSQFQFRVVKLDRQPASAIVLLSCYNHCPKFHLGDRWRFQAKLKKPQNLGNPGHFDYVAWLRMHHINWTGYIKSQAMTRLAGARGLSLLALRQHFAHSASALMSHESSLGIFEAISLGLTSHIDKTLWDLFRRTGTTHLMVISGSHIGLAAGLSFWLMRWFWTRSARLCLFYPAPQAASFVALIVALAYSLLAGFGAPTQRALLTCFFMLMKNFLSGRFSVWQAWRYALLSALLLEPHDVLSPGFYLSFLAVACLILVNQRFAVQGIKKVILLQLSCLFGLLPLTLYWFSYGALNGFAANLLAVPMVELFIVPYSLAGLFLIQFWQCPWILWPIDVGIKVLLGYLGWIDSFSFINLQFSFNDILPVLSLMLTMFLALFFPIRPVLPAIAVLFLASLWPGKQRLAEGEAAIDVVDVGQGLAIVVRTANHNLVYDSGMKFYKGGDMANLAIIPYLEWVGVKSLDAIIISHPDLDHRGGLASLEEKYPGVQLLSNEVSFYRHGLNCHDYPPWTWDGVYFQFLPINERFPDKNNRSCVLKISTENGQVLFTGDIERLAEHYLLMTYGDHLKADVLVVPHHGSKTSSSKEFIGMVAPKYAIISSGLDNRYHFPHQKTLDTFNEKGIIWFNTSSCGMFSVRLGNKEAELKPKCFNSPNNGEILY
nr:DNA internalization-related competence protein ComEC/Rec2 [Legionella jordanis]